MRAAPGLSAFAIVIQVLLALGCASAEERRAARTGPVSVEVTNHNFLDANVYAVAGGQAVRLGTVTTNSTQTFEVPPAIPLTHDLRFLVDPIGSSGAFLSDEIVVTGGETVELVIQPNLDLSTVSVR
jgi:hypothetical protein